MAYDQKLAERVRGLMKGRKGVTEKEMFGGLAFLRDTKMFVGVNKDEFLARVGKEAHAEWMKKPGTRPMDFTGKPMVGYIFVKNEKLAGKALDAWVDFCWEHVASVVKKPKKPKEKVTPKKKAKG
jgi:hypothetical protein